MELWQTLCDHKGSGLRVKANRMAEQKDENNWNAKDATEWLT